MPLTFFCIWTVPNQLIKRLLIKYLLKNKMENKSILKIEGLSHKYSVQWAIRDINLDVDKVGVYGLLGSNGAGKSTTMNILCGVLSQTAGEVYVKGINIRQNPIEAKRHIGFLPQKPPIYPELTVEEYLSYTAQLRDIPTAEIPAAVADVMELVGITHFSKRLISNLSGGFQQRVGIAQALIHKPDLLVLDEPTNGLDPNQILEIRQLIKELAKDRTVLLSTHILTEVQASCDHIWMIEQGKMVFSGTVDDFDNYIQPSTILCSLLTRPTVEQLQAIPGLLEATPLAGTQYRLRFSDAQEALERVVETSVEQGWRLNEIFLEKSSMDSIFAELSKKDV